MPATDPIIAGSAGISSAEVPPDVHGLVVHVDGFTVATGGRALLVHLPPGEAVMLARHLLRGAERRGLAISDRDRQAPDGAP